MTGLQIAALVASATAAGAINAVAGGGTLVTFPTLVLVGTPNIVANATDVGAGHRYGGQHLRLPAADQRGQDLAGAFRTVSLAGGLLGSWLLIHTSEQFFARLVPFLILFATVLFLAQNAFRRFARPQDHAPDSGRRGIGVAVAFQFAVAVYGGYFGAGIGILMLASLGFLGLSDIHEMNALKNVLGSLINLVAAVVFTVGGLIDWPKMWIMTGGALVGYYLGAHFSQRLPQQHVRRLITTIGFVMSAVTFWKQFH